MTLDGFIAGPKGEMDFMVWDWDKELVKYVDEITQPVDCIVLGRKLAEGFIPYWANVAADPNHAEFTAGKMFTETSKVVFTGTLKTSEWENTVLAKGDVVNEINKLKASNYGGSNDIIAYGGAKFVSSLIKYELIDEYHLFINPTAIATGMPIFSELYGTLNLKLIKSVAFECGIVVLHYQKNTSV